MIEKLKAWGESSKGAFLYIITPLVFGIGFIYYLINKNKILEHKLEQASWDETHTRTLTAEEQADAEAKAAIDRYNAVRDRGPSSS